MFNQELLLNTLIYNKIVRYKLFVYRILSKNKIYNQLIIRNKRIHNSYTDLGMNKHTNFYKKRNMFNIYLDAFLLKKQLVYPLMLRYYKDRFKFILESIKSYKFYRIIAKLPLNGQNTHSNRRTFRKLIELTPIFPQSENKKNQKLRNIRRGKKK